MRNVFVSLDPFQRLALLPSESRVPTVRHRSHPIGVVMGSHGVSVVVESCIEGPDPETMIVCESGWQSYCLVEGDAYRRIDGTSPASAALGVLGIPGFSGWVGLKCIGEVRAGQTMVVSATSGAVGSLVVQLARRWGCRAIGIAGSEQKCRWVREELGAEECVNYRSVDVERELANACTEGVDVF